MFSLNSFLASFWRVYGEPGCTSSAASALLCLAASTVGQYGFKFCILTSELARSNEAVAFYKGLSGHIKDQLVG